MKKRDAIAEAILQERFGKDSLIALATVEEGLPCVRTVDALYLDGAFYVITHAMSIKMRQIGRNPNVAICGDWFTARGYGENLGFVGKPENATILAALRKAFAAWIDNGHSNLEDKNTCILKIRLAHGVLFSDGIRYEIDFT